MKKWTRVSLAIVAILTTVGTAHADVLLGGEVGADAWFTNTKANNQDCNSTVGSYYVSIEHFIPLVPNVRLSYDDLNNSVASFNQMDYTAYYEILDNDLISLDVGLTATKFNAGKVGNQTFNTWQPSLYAHAKVGIPFTPLSAFTTFNAGNFDSNKTFDGTLGVEYSIPFIIADANIRAGYRMMDYQFKDISSDIKINGWFAGVSIDI
jgi:outer membrane protein